MAAIRLGLVARKLIAENLGNSTLIEKLDSDWPSFRKWLCEQCGGQSRYLLTFKDFKKGFSTKEHLSFCSDYCVKKFWESEDPIEYVRSEIRSEMGSQTVGFTDTWGAQLGWLNCQHYGPNDW